MNIFADKKIIPVLMFHSIGLQKSPWIYSHISESVAFFEKKLKLFKKKCFNSIFWFELYEYMQKKRDIPENSIMLTFDDGYLDNWIYVYPYLKKYNIKATIFVNPEFADPGNKKRLNIEDVWEGRCGIKDLEPRGFLNWAEMREMEKSGLIDIQSHSMTHTWYFSGQRIVDYHKPAKISPYPWLFWNKKPDQKPFYLNNDQQSFVKYGHPVFEHEKSLIVKRYYPDENFIFELIDFIEKNGGETFFSTKEWQKKLEKQTLKIHHGNLYKGEYESENEYLQRIKQELTLSKKIIEQKLHKQVDFICWPGGGYNNTVLKFSRKAGYKAWTLSSRDLSSFRNIPGVNAENIKRIGTSNKVSIKKYGNGIGGPLYQILNINTHRNSFVSKQLLRLYKLVAIFNSA